MVISQKFGQMTIGYLFNAKETNFKITVSSMYLTNTDKLKALKLKVLINQKQK